MASIPPEKVKQLIDRDALIAAVDEVIGSTVDGINWGLSFSQLDISQISNLGKMLSERCTLVDLNADMKNTALATMLRDTMELIYPHPGSVRWLINDVFIGAGYKDLGIISEAFARLRYYLPVARNRDYYMKILKGCFIMTQKDTKSSSSFFWFVMDELSSLAKTSEFFPDSQHSYSSDRAPTDDEDNMKEKKVTYFCDLDQREKKERLEYCASIICDWLEDDFREWMRDTKFDQRSLIGQLFWENEDEEGAMSSSIRKLLTLWEQPPYFKRLLELVAELVRRRDRTGVQMYPFLGFNSNELARELAAKILPIFTISGVASCEKHVWPINPSWLRLATTSYILTDLTGFQCSPELSCAIIIMEHLEHIYKVGRRETRIKSKTENVPLDQELVKRFAKLPSVNVPYRSGMSRLVKACKDKCETEVHALLSFPLLDLNQPDWMERTALWHACKSGSFACAKALLDHAPPVGSTQRRVNTRAADKDGYTPLMIAAQAGHTEICRLLLQHSGSVLLDDLVNENDSALELCATVEVRSLLKKYKEKRVETIYSKPELTLATGDNELVAELSVVLIQSYLEVHRTWDIYHLLKRNAKLAIPMTPKRPTVLCEYSRYHRDFRTHINRVRGLAMKLKKIPYLSDVTQLLLTLVTMNK